MDNLEVISCFNSCNNNNNYSTKKIWVDFTNNIIYETLPIELEITYPEVDTNDY